MANIYGDDDYEIDEFGRWEPYVPVCDHEWVWSGVPKGDCWCKKCDVNYDKTLHGELKDLSSPRNTFFEKEYYDRIKK